MRVFIALWGMCVAATPLNHFAHIEAVGVSENNEVRMGKLSRRAIADGRCFPGLFL